MENLIVSFYTAFQDLDAETMANCYHDDVIFEDPAFGILKGQRAGNMWRMLCATQKGKDFKLTYSKVKSDEKIGSAQWEAFYTFTKTNRKIHNTVYAQFEFHEGKFIKHVDDFDLYSWSKQALGFKGAVLGKTLFFKNKIRYNTHRMLNKFESKQQDESKR